MNALQGCGIGLQVGAEHSDKPLRECVAAALEDYFRHLNGHPPGELYQMVLNEVELPLLKAVLNHTQGNQTRAAELLGINRGTLRKKLKQYGLDH